MVNLSFSDKELETLKEYFQAELVKAQEQVENIRGILGKIGKKPGLAGKETPKGTTKGGRSKVVKSVVGKKKPGPKPKKGLAELIEILDKSEDDDKKPGRSLRKPEPEPAVVIPVAEKPVVKAKSGTKKPAVKKAEKKPAKVKTVAKKEPKAKKVVVKAVKPVPVKKAAVKKIAVKQPVVVKAAEPKAETPKKVTKPKREKRTLRLKVTKNIGKVPEWGDWVIAVVQENPQMVSHQIADAVINRYDLSGDNLVDAPEMVNQILGELTSSGVLMAYGDDSANPMYGLKMTE